MPAGIKSALFVRHVQQQSAAAVAVAVAAPSFDLLSYFASRVIDYLRVEKDATSTLKLRRHQTNEGKKAGDI